MSVIYHISTGPNWAQAQRDGEYTMSTRDKTLAEEGFIHCSDASQVAGVANVFYPGERDLLLLVIEPERVTSRVQYDPVADQRYPHIYGPLNLDAVVEMRPFAPASDGIFRFTETLLSERAVVPPPVTCRRSHRHVVAARRRSYR
jgi:uncharacterized protein (DUF952 family)